MFCGVCGKPLAVDRLYCTYCGARVDYSARVPDSMPTAQPQAQVPLGTKAPDGYREGPPSRGGVKLSVVVIGVVAVIVAVALFLHPELKREQPSVDVAKILTLLPEGSEVLEQVGLPAEEPRVAVLWMMTPQTIDPDPDPDVAGNCPDAVMGRRLRGLTAVSLVDTGALRLINTVAIHRGNELDSFEIPIRASADGYYAVPKTDKFGLGRPRILNLRDYTGEGVEAQFPLFSYEGCGLSSGTMLGYSQILDKIVQYPVTELGGGKSGEDITSFWAEHVFWEQPIQPGHWNFTWDPGHGSDGKIHVDAVFDRDNQRYVEKDIIIPYPE